MRKVICRKRANIVHWKWNKRAVEVANIDVLVESMSACTLCSEDLRALRKYYRKMIKLPIIPVFLICLDAFNNLHDEGSRWILKVYEHTSTMGGENLGWRTLTGIGSKESDFTLCCRQMLESE